MSEKRDYLVFIEDIISSIKKIEKYTNNLSYKEFSGNEMIIDAVVRNFEVMGEATKKLPDELKKRHSQIEWKKAAGFRDVLIHDYFGIDIEAIWDTIKNDIPEFKRQILKVLKSERNSKRLKE